MATDLLESFGKIDDAIKDKTLDPSWSPKVREIHEQAGEIDRKLATKTAITKDVL